jgi:hypothetical protein
MFNMASRGLIWLGVVLACPPASAIDLASNSEAPQVKERGSRFLPSHRMSLRMIRADYICIGSEQSCEAVFQLSSRCDGRQACSLQVEAQDLCGDPCPGNPKYLDFRFACQNAEHWITRKPMRSSDAAIVSLVCNDIGL